ncbi:hypothetical protein [Providencia manganoxydans]|uniref:hypothetical protein n=1 Tax=Providencia manganoxydans TaxID=2923283 RepID=UPI0034E4A364
MKESTKGTPAGLNAAMGSTASLGTIFVSLAALLPSPYNQVFTIITPVLSGAISWLGIYLYNRMMEPPAVVALRAGLKKDLAAQLEVINDDNCDEETKEAAKKIYSSTRLSIATLRQDYASGKFTATTSVDKNM